MIASIPSAALVAVRGRPVLVEAHVSNGLLTSRWLACPKVACTFLVGTLARLQTRRTRRLACARRRALDDHHDQH
jgi:hypothetical protein